MEKIITIMLVVVICLFVLASSPYSLKVNTDNQALGATKVSNDQMIIITLHPDDPYMTVNGVSQEIDPGRGTKPVIIPEWSRTVVPIRAIVEALGGMIRWEGTERKVTINFKGTVIELWIDNPAARVNGTTVYIDDNNHNVKPIIVNDRAMLPLRFVAENLGCNVDWFSNEQAVTIIFPSPLIQIESKEIVKVVKGNETVLVDVPITNPFNWQTKIKVRLISNDCPKDWSSDFCVKNACYFREGEILLEKKEKTVIQVSIYTTEAGKANFTLIISGEEIPEEILYISLKEEG